MASPDPVLIEDWGRAAVPSAAVVGPRRQAVWLRFQGMVDQVNVSFVPGAAGAFVGLPMPELVGRMASPDDVWPHDFREAVAELEPSPSWALLAAGYGYADQAHLAREFRELTGLTPSRFAGSDADFLQDALACRQGV